MLSNWIIIAMQSFTLIDKTVISLILINATFISWAIPIQSLDVRFLASHKRTFQVHLKDCCYYSLNVGHHMLKKKQDENFLKYVSFGLILSSV